MEWFESWEQECNLKLLTGEERRGGFYFENVLRAFLRGDMKARAEFYNRMFLLGSISTNEIRALENMDPVAGGNRYFVPLNLAPLDDPLPGADEPAAPTLSEGADGA